MENTNELTLAQLQAQIEELQAKITKLENSRQDQLSIAVVSGDLDKILAAMVISIAAAAMDTQVKLFFSFWSLSALRDPKNRQKEKMSFRKCLAVCFQKEQKNSNCPI